MAIVVSMLYLGVYTVREVCADYGNMISAANERRIDIAAVLILVAIVVTNI